MADDDKRIDEIGIHLKRRDEKVRQQERARIRGIIEKWRKQMRFTGNSEKVLELDKLLKEIEL
jgi:hypothetical protein